MVDGCGRCVGAVSPSTWPSAPPYPQVRAVPLPRFWHLGCAAGHKTGPATDQINQIIDKKKWGESKRVRRGDTKTERCTYILHTRSNSTRRSFRKQRASLHLRLRAKAHEGVLKTPGTDWSSFAPILMTSCHTLFKSIDDI